MTSPRTTGTSGAWSCRPADGKTVEYLLDAMGRRIGRKIDGVLDRGYLWSGGRIAAELDAAGAVVARFVYGSRAHA